MQNETNTAEGGNTSPGTGDRTFTQAELDTIIKDRLLKEKAKAGADLEKREKDLQQREFMLAARETLSQRGLPVEILDAINASDNAGLIKSLDILDKAYTSRTVAAGTNEPDAALLEKIHAAAIEAGKLDALGIKALKKHTLDKSIVKHINGEITNMDEIMEHYKADSLIGDLWGGETRTEGAGNGSPPVYQGATERDMFKEGFTEK